MFDKIKGFVGNDQYFYTILILLVAISSFGIGRISAVEGPSNRQTAAVSVTTPEVKLLEGQDKPVAIPSQQTFVASAKGAKYHLPTCPGAKQISDKNKIYFATKAEAESSGYTPAANCPGIQ